MERLEAMFAEGVPSWFNNPKLLAMKAVDDSTGEMIGSVCWGFHAYPEIDARKAEMDKKVGISRVLLILTDIFMMMQSL